MVAASSGLKAFVSRLRAFLRTSTVIPVKGFFCRYLCRAAQLNTLREAASQTSRTVSADRAPDSNPPTHERAASSVTPLAPMSAKSLCICRKTARHLCTVWSAGFVALTNASNNCQQPGPTAMRCGLS